MTCSKLYVHGLMVISYMCAVPQLERKSELHVTIRIIIATRGNLINQMYTDTSTNVIS